MKSDECRVTSDEKDGIRYLSNVTQEGWKNNMINLLYRMFHFN